MIRQSFKIQKKKIKQQFRIYYEYFFGDIIQQFLEAKGFFKLKTSENPTFKNKLNFKIYE